MSAQILQLLDNIRSAEEPQQTIRIEQLIKDVNFESQSKKGVLPKCVNSTYTKDSWVWYLQQSFQEQKSQNTDDMIVPMLLVPLFKIKDQQDQDVDYSTFERCNINEVTVYYDNYYVGYRRLYLDYVKNAQLHVGDKKSINLIEKTRMYKSGFLIFKDFNSNGAMLYYGLLINVYNFNDPDNELGLLFKQYVLQDEQNTERTTRECKVGPENISIEIEFDTAAINSSIDFILPDTEEPEGYQEYTLTLNKYASNLFNIKIESYLKNCEVYFRVIRNTKNTKDEEIFMRMAKISKKP